MSMSRNTRKKSTQLRFCRLEGVRLNGVLKVKWKKIINVSYDEDLLKLIFGGFGAIKACVIIPEKKAAIIEFFNLSSAVN